jgi:hypothetical protein
MATARDEVESFGFVQPWTVRHGSALSISLVGLAAVVSGVTAHFLGLNGPQTATTTIAFGAFMLGYFQWLAARRENSMDKYYERLELADRRLNEWPAARSLFRSAPDGQDETTEALTLYHRTMYAYYELDNLEYAIEKYKLGYISADIALRALRTFQSRCAAEDFRSLARACVVTAGYQPSTAKTVSNVCREFQPTHHEEAIFPIVTRPRHTVHGSGSRDGGPTSGVGLGT